MDYTNKHGLSDISMSWLLHDEYDYEPGVLSATTLLRPVRSIVLFERYYDKMVMDVSDLIASKYGTAIHASFEKVPYDESINQEERLYTTVDGHRISGKYDILQRTEDGFKLWDLKSTSVWNYIYGNKTEEFIKQLSMYRLLLEKNCYDGVRDIATVIMVFTDWSKSRAKRGGDYPPIRMAEPDIRLMNFEDTLAFIRERLSLIGDARKLSDDELPLCTDEELWKDDDKFAHMRKGRKSAVKLYDSEAEAQEAVDADDKGFLEVRKGMVNRCPMYCPCHPFCNQFKDLVERGLVEVDEDGD